VYPDIEVLLTAFFKEATGKRTLTELPGDLESILQANEAVIQVARSPSPAGYRLDRPQVDVSVWTLKAKRGVCSALARQIPRLLERDLKGVRRPQGVVTSVRVDVAPYWQSDPNPKLCRYLASYGLAAHT
jgi:hypothetical protein